MPARQLDCSKCGAPKKRTAAGRLICRPCEAAYHRARRTADPEANRVRCRGYAAAHREEAKQRANEWHYANKAKAKASHAAKYQANREAERAKRREHYLQTSEAYKERARRSTWRQDNPEAARVVVQRRRARRREAVCEHGVRCVTSAFLKVLYASRCTYCGAPAEHADHFQPLTRGGLHCKENLVPACGPCNTSKHAADPVKWLAERHLLA